MACWLLPLPLLLVHCRTDAPLPLPPACPPRRNFDKWFKQTFTSVKMPGKGTVYDYFVNPKTGKFQPWAELVTDVSYDSSTPMSTVFVPTAETSSLRFFLDLMVDLRKPIMFVGTAGVGARPGLGGRWGGAAAAAAADRPLFGIQCGLLRLTTRPTLPCLLQARRSWCAASWRACRRT